MEVRGGRIMAKSIEQQLKEIEVMQALVKQVESDHAEWEEE